MSCNLPHAKSVACLALAEANLTREHTPSHHPSAPTAVWYLSAYEHWNGQVKCALLPKIRLKGDQLKPYKEVANYKLRFNIKAIQKI